MRKVVIYVGVMLLCALSVQAQSDKEGKYEDLVTKYFQYYEQQKPDSAEIMLHQALALMPDADSNFMLRGNLAELMVARADTVGAISQLSLAIGQQPDIANLRSRRAQLLEDSGKLNDALLDLDYLVQQDENKEIPRYNRARVRMKLGLLEGSKSDLEKIIEHNNEAYLPRIALAKVLYKEGDMMASEKVLTYLIETYPKVPNAYRERARLRMKQDRKALALEDIRYIFNELKTITPEDYRIRGDIWMLYGEKDQAEKDFERAIDLENLQSFNLNDK
ncbi:tetratricopeptide repeat protein [Porphyromonadaceae bacterium W3.11]|nr:tetratricopeptide repeat protein [Porphyromonadaceae bacterium W3.11]